MLDSGRTLAFALLGQSPPAQPQAAPQQKPERPPIVIPPDTPPPVGEELRVKPDDIDALLAEGKVLLLDVREPWGLEEDRPARATSTSRSASSRSACPSSPKTKPSSPLETAVDGPRVPRPC